MAEEPVEYYLQLWKQHDGSCLLYLFHVKTSIVLNSVFRWMVFSCVCLFVCWFPICGKQTCCIKFWLNVQNSLFCFFPVFVFNLVSWNTASDNNLWIKWYFACRFMQKISFVDLFLATLYFNCKTADEKPCLGSMSWVYILIWLLKFLEKPLLN